MKKLAMKKIIITIITVIMVSMSLVGCGNKTENSEKKLSIVTTIFPEYDWIKELTKGNESVEITMLLDKGVDLHSYKPSADDIVKISSCDMFVYVGGESDEWVTDVLANAKNKDMVAINLLDVLGEKVKEEEVIEGMDNSKEEESEGEKEEEKEYDEHVWLSLKNSKILCQYIADELMKLDSKNKATYESNANRYVGELASLDSEYEEATKVAKVKTLLFGDRFPFRYLVDDYGLKYYAAFVGCSAESEASFETIKFLANKVDELGLKNIFKLDGSDGKIAETIKNTTSSKNQEILVLDSMQSKTMDDVKKDNTYIKIMKSNLDVLKKAIN